MDAGSKIWSWQNWVFYMCDHGISEGLCMVSIWLGSSGCCSRWERQWPQAGQTVSPGTTSTSRPTTRLDRAIAILIPTFFPISCRCCNFSKIGLGGCFFVCLFDCQNSLLRSLQGLGSQRQKSELTWPPTPTSGRGEGCDWINLCWPQLCVKVDERKTLMLTEVIYFAINLDTGTLCDSKLIEQLFHILWILWSCHKKMNTKLIMCICDLKQCPVNFVKRALKCVINTGRSLRFITDMSKHAEATTKTTKL